MKQIVSYIGILVISIAVSIFAVKYHDYNQWAEVQIKSRSSENIVYDEILSSIESGNTARAVELITVLKEANIALIEHLSKK